MVGFGRFGRIVPGGDQHATELEHREGVRKAV
jgi:hypothetical protein